MPTEHRIYGNTLIAIFRRVECDLYRLYAMDVAVVLINT